MNNPSNQANKEALAAAQATFANEYVTIGKGKKVWFVEDFSFAGVQLSTSTTKGVSYKTVPFDKIDTLKIWTR